MSSKQPASKIETYFPITAAIWRNESREGKVFYSATLERRYKDDKGEWQGTGSYGADDLLLLQKVAGLAHTEIFRLMKVDRDAQREPGAEG